MGNALGRASRPHKYKLFYDSTYAANITDAVGGPVAMLTPTTYRPDCGTFLLSLLRIPIAKCTRTRAALGTICEVVADGGSRGVATVGAHLPCRQWVRGEHAVDVEWAFLHSCARMSQRRYI